MAEEGDHRNVDMLVSDIYGGDYSGMGLPGDLIACSFGKAIHSSKDKNFNPGELFYAFKNFYLTFVSVIKDLDFISSMYCKL